MNFDPAFIKHLKDSVCLSEIVEKTVKLKKSGKNYKGLCPFHSDVSPSLQINDELQQFKCWSCPAKGDVFDWLMERENFSDFAECVRFLSSRAGLPVPTNISPEEQKELKEIYTVLNQAAFMYQKGLDKNPLAQKYLQERGLTSETISKWGLGVVSSGISPFLKCPSELSCKVGISGVNEKGDIYERLKQKIIIPIHSASGKLIGFSGRKFQSWDGSGKYNNPPKTLLFNKSLVLYGLYHALPSVRETSTIVVVEGYFDVIMLHQYGEHRAVSPMGTAITDEQLTVLLSKAGHIIFALDHDKGGTAGVKQLLPKLLSLVSDKHVISFVFLSAGEDPDSFIRKYGLLAWNEALLNCVSLSEMIFKYIGINQGPCSIENMQRTALRAEAVCKAIKCAPYLRQLIEVEVKEKLKVNLEISDES